MPTKQLIELIVLVALLGLVLYRQLATRRISGRNFIVPVILVGLGLKVAFQYLELHTVGTLELVSFGIAVAISVALAFPRARSLTIWYADGSWWAKGTWVTLVLWLVTFASHFLVSTVVGLVTSTHVAGGFGTATIMFRIGLSLGVQAMLRIRRGSGTPVRPSMTMAA